HYRLSFAIVPLLLVQVAALVDDWVWSWLNAARVRQAVGIGAVLLMLLITLSVGLEYNAEYWFSHDLPDDDAKYSESIRALMLVVHSLQAYEAEHGAPPVVLIPGEDRLPFFFPDWDIRNSRDKADLPTTLDDLDGVDIYVDSSTSVFLSQLAGVYPNQLTALAEVGLAYHTVNAVGPDGARWPTVLQPVPLHPDGSIDADDGVNRYTVFTVHPDARLTPMNPGGRRDDSVIVGEFARFLGYDVTGLDWYRDTRVFLTLYWQPTAAAPPPQDYSVYIHLLDADGQFVAGWDAEPMQGAYPTRLWQPGESVMDYWVLDIPPDIPVGPVDLWIGLYDGLTGERLPVVIDGQASGDGLKIESRIIIR
ncbi:MAG: hypothetical protein JW966_14495, partial [Anaerolineae bacterium]|nr:hypothetical protein [Anaerolineae bacterium]